MTKSYYKLSQVFGGLIEFNFKLHRLFQTATNFILKCGCYRKVVTIQGYTLESFFIAEIFSRTSIMKSYIIKIFEEMVNEFQPLNIFAESFTTDVWQGPKYTRSICFCKDCCPKRSRKIDHFSSCNFIKKETLAQVLSCELCEIFKNTFFYGTPLDDCFCIFWTLNDVQFTFSSQGG